jgi:hypothetical protein
LADIPDLVLKISGIDIEKLTKLDLLVASK